jgi:hypothetical protein
LCLCFLGNELDHTYAQQKEKKMKKKAEKNYLQNVHHKLSRENKINDKDEVIAKVIESNKSIITFNTNQQGAQLSIDDIERLKKFLVPTKAFIINFVDCIMKIPSLKKAIENYLLQLLSSQVKLLKKRKIGYVSIVNCYTYVCIILIVNLL